MKWLRYLIEAILVYGSYAVLWLLPVKIASAMLGALVRKVGPQLKIHHIAKNNLTHAFPEMSVEERDNILDKMWDNLGRTVGEFSFVGRCTRLQYDQHVELEGAHYLEENLTSGKPAIFFSAHMANWELAPKTAAMFGTPLALVYRPSNNPMVEAFIKYVRNHYQSAAIAKGSAGARDVLKCLKQGLPVGMLLDQKMNDGIPVPFFGRDAMTAPAVAQLARKFDCPVIPAQVIRKEGVSFKVIIHKPLAAPNTGDATKDSYDFMCQINHMIEGWVRQHPEQWFWVHNRWPK